jgi:hypothetical protein
MLTLVFALNAFEGIFHTKLMIAPGNMYRRSQKKCREGSTTVAPRSALSDFRISNMDEFPRQDMNPDFRPGTEA